ncbi:hypothetical protein K0M31_012637 [Melipona bicolor]|uniref:Uncharacterized protein n=1 Tax=Melipona bicolor TaxID=60889 RepID=A0AA40FJI4_9HYME|nr:hypothetical protein K0M31_012637 [Melipona bicolor]
MNEMGNGLKKEGTKVKERFISLFLFFSPNNQKYSQAVNFILILKQIKSRKVKRSENESEKKKHRGSGFSLFLSIRILLAREAFLACGYLCTFFMKKKKNIYIYI